MSMSTSLTPVIPAACVQQGAAASSECGGRGESQRSALCGPSGPGLPRRNPAAGAPKAPQRPLRVPYLPGQRSAGLRYYKDSSVE